MSEQKILSNRELFSDRNLKFIFAVTLAGTMGVSLITPVLPKIVEAFEITKSQVSWVIIAYTLPGLLASPFHGALSDKWGRKTILVPLLILFGIFGFLSGFAVHFWQLLLFRFLQGLGGSGLFTLNHALIGDIYRGKTRVQIMGINAAMISVGTAAFPAIGGLLGEMHWRYPFYISIFAVGVGPIVLFKMENLEIHTNESMSKYMKQALISIRNWKIVRLYILSFTTFLITFGPIIAYLPLLMSDKFGSTPFSIGMVMTVASLSSAVFSTYLGRISGFMRTHYILAFAFALYTIVFFWISKTVTPWHLLVAGGLFGMGQGLNIPNIQAMLVSSAPLEVRGVFMAFNSMVILLGISGGPIMASLIYKYWGILQIYYSAGVLTLIFMFLILFAGKDIKI